MNFFKTEFTPHRHHVTLTAGQNIVIGNMEWTNGRRAGCSFDAMRVSCVQGVRFTSSVPHLALAVFVLGPHWRHILRLAPLGGLGAKMSVRAGAGSVEEGEKVLWCT